MCANFMQDLSSFAFPNNKQIEGLFDFGNFRND
jgi:hypothetical protein